MNIEKITPKVQVYGFNNQNKDVKSNQLTIQNLGNNEYKLASSINYIGYQPNFTGGYSLDLGETIKNLDKLAQRYPNIYPKNVREWAGMILEEGNKYNDTLIDIHKSLYANIKDCFSLAELKARFPEFKDVKSANDVDYQKGSLLDDLVSGRVEEFNTEEDISLQLIKLYWGEGFSLNDLKKYAGDRDLNSTMNKLGIPKVDRNYGHVLKFSDPEYNERLTKQMVQKRQESLDIKAQHESGEPVYIKRGPLSEEHKKHISEGLTKYYQENPERILEMSERQKQYYKDNPEQAEVMHRVMIKAWNVFSAKNIKVSLSNFMKKNGIRNFSEEELKTPELLSKEQSQLMKRFWDLNPWAKKAFSNNMTYAWKKVKAEQDMVYTIDVTPEAMKRKFFNWCDRNNIDKTDLNFDFIKYAPHHPEQNQEYMKNTVPLINAYLPRFIDDMPGDESQKMANTYQRTLIKFGKELLSMSNDKNLDDETKNLTIMLRRVIHTSMFDEDNAVRGIPTPRVYGASEIQDVYSLVLRMMMDQHNDRLINLLNKRLNESYGYIDKNWKPGNPIILAPDAHKF